MKRKKLLYPVQIKNQISEYKRVCVVWKLFFISINPMRCKILRQIFFSVQILNISESNEKSNKLYERWRNNYVQIRFLDLKASN